MLWYTLDQTSSIVINYLCRLNNGQHILKCNNIRKNAYQTLIHSRLDCKSVPVFYTNRTSEYRV